MANLTLSADPSLIEKAREAARRQGTTLNELVRGYLRTLAGESEGRSAARELLEHMRTRGGHSGGRRLRRDDAYEGRPR